LHDEHVGLVYNRARHLHPKLGRFVQRDPAGYVDGMGLYAYIQSSPLRKLDPSGAMVNDRPDDPNDIVDGSFYIYPETWDAPREGTQPGWHTFGETELLLWQMTVTSSTDNCPVGCAKIVVMKGEQPDGSTIAYGAAVRIAWVVPDVNKKDSHEAHERMHAAAWERSWKKLQREAKPHLNDCMSAEKYRCWRPYITQLVVVRKLEAQVASRKVDQDTRPTTDEEDLWYH
jgi:RHS repeat-associated protein